MLVTIWLTIYGLMKQIYIYVYVKYGRYDETEKNTTYVAGKLIHLRPHILCEMILKEKHGVFFHFSCGRH